MLNLFVDDTKWEYLAEGGANVVFRYFGDDVNYLGKVLRVKKTRAQGEAERNPDFDDQCVYYARQVVGRLLGHEYALEMQKVTVGRLLLEILSAKLLGYRERDVKRELDQLDLTQNHALLLTDATKPPAHLIKSINLSSFSIAVEIKPKWGFFSVETRNDGRVTKHCRFCAHQHLKNSGSKYCPMDLFSNDFGRIRNAFQCLRGLPSNNLREFNNTAFCSSTSLSLKDAVYTLLSRYFSQNDLLNKLKHHQEVLHGDGIVETTPMDFSSEFTTSVIEDYLNGKSHETSNDYEALKRRLALFLLSVSLKDISIITRVTFTLDRITEDASLGKLMPGELISEFREMSGIEAETLFIYVKSTVVDAEPKSARKLQHYIKLQEQINEHYFNNPINRIPCI